MDDGIKFQIKYFGSHYNKNVRFLFYSRVIKGKQSTSFDHTIFNVIDAKDNHTILYFENLNPNGNLIDGLGDPVRLGNATNMKYVTTEIAKISGGLLPLNGSKSMTGNLDMDNNKILKIEKNLTDHKDDDPYEDIVKDLKSAVNKEYLNEKFLKVDKDGNDFNLKQKTIKNCEPYYDGLFSDNDLVSKAFVDTEIGKLPKPETDVLKLDGSKAMTGNLDMGNKDIVNANKITTEDNIICRGNLTVKNNVLVVKSITANDDIKSLSGTVEGKNLSSRGVLFVNNNQIRGVNDGSAPSHAVDKRQIDKKLPLDGSSAMNGNLDMGQHSIINLKDPEAHQATYAVNVKFVADAIVDNNTLINTKIRASETRAIESIDRENVFKKVMDDDEFKEDDDDIHKVGVQNKNFHLVNKKTYEFKIDYDSSIGYYSTRLSIDLIYLSLGSYTMVYEMYIDDGITIDEIDVHSGTLRVGKINSRIDGTKTRSIIHFTKYTFSSGFDDLDIDIKLKGKTDPQTTIYVAVYGVKNQVNNVSVNLWDRFYYYDNDNASVKYEAPIDMNKKDITDVNKITTGDLDVNGQIDIKGNKIIGVGNGTANSDAVNKSQLDAVVTYVKTEVAYLTSRYTRDINLTRNSLTKLQYYYFTDQLRHDNSKTVKFPTLVNYPYSAVNNSEYLTITLDGHYQIIYTDFYKKKWSIYNS